MTDLPDLESLRVLTAVAATGSLTAASARLGISQQAVSLRIRGLEMSIGVPLIIRSSRGSDLTATGELVVGWAAAVLAAADGFTTSVAALHQDRRR
jgi:DNA-binding transcriptional LysR family regulator